LDLFKPQITPPSRVESQGPSTYHRNTGIEAIAVASRDGPSSAIILAPTRNSSPDEMTIGGEKTLSIGTCMARVQMLQPQKNGELKLIVCAARYSDWVLEVSHQVHPRET